MSLGSVPHNVSINWESDRQCADKYVEGMKSEGTFLMLSELRRTGVIDDVEVFYESNRGSGFANWGHGITGHVCPQIDWVRQFIDKDTVIYVRGGFRGWYKLLTDYKNKNWLICYNANTGREKWTFWDIILWDLEKRYQVDRHGRFWYYYKKPVDEKMFYPIDHQRLYDVCIGASHIHDKKGQWRVINALIEYKNKYGKNLKAILPGYGNRGTQTSQIMTKIHDNGLDVTIPGMMPRSYLNDAIFNRSRLGVFLGTHGQGDRGPIEALATGLPLIIGSKKYHSPSVYDSRVARVPKNINDFKELADLLHVFLGDLPSRKNVYNYFKSELGFKEACYPNLSFIFDFIRNNPSPTLEAKQELLKLCNQEEHF